MPHGHQASARNAFCWVYYYFVFILFYFIIIYLLLFCFVFSCSIGVELLALPIPSKLSTTELQPQGQETRHVDTRATSPAVGSPGILTSATGPTELHRALTRLYFQESQLWVLWRVQSSLLAPAAGRVRVQLARSQACGKTQCKEKRL